MTTAHVDGDTTRVTVASDAYACFVHLVAPHPATTFSDNHFDLRAGESRELLLAAPDGAPDPARPQLRAGPHRRAMTDLPLSRLGEFLDGHVGLLPRGEALQPLRMPVADRHLHDRFTRWVAAIPSGVRLRLRTDSRSLHLHTQQRQTLVGQPARVAVGVRPVHRRRASRGACRPRAARAVSCWRR